MERLKQAKWDAAHLATVSTRMQVPKYLLLRALCRAAGTTPYALIKLLLEEWMAGVAGSWGALPGEVPPPFSLSADGNTAVKDCARRRALPPGLPPAGGASRP